MTPLEFIQAQLKPIKADYNMAWSEVGLESLEFIELIQQVEQEFDVTVPDSEFKNIKTIGDLVILVNRLQDDRYVCH